MSSMPFQSVPDTLTPREIELYRQEKEMSEMQSQHVIELKKLELAIVEKETRWSATQKIPLTLIKLPLLVLLGVAYICMVLTKQQPTEDFWKLIK